MTKEYQDWLDKCPVKYNQEHTLDEGDDNMHVLVFTVPKKPEVKPTEIKDYTVKYDVCIWFDRNFLVQADSQEEAEQKAKELMHETENDLYATVNPTPSLDYKKLEDWVFGDAQFKLDTVHVVED